MKVSRSMDQIDAFDRKLLDLLSVDSRQTGQALSEKVGLSPAACLRRVQRLRAIGAIEREVAVISPRFSGGSVLVLVLLEVSRDRADRIEVLTAKFRRLREVERFYQVTGRPDLALMMRFDTMEDYAAFTEAHFYEGPIVGFESLVVLREHRKDAPGP